MLTIKKKPKTNKQTKNKPQLIRARIWTQVMWLQDHLFDSYLFGPWHLDVFPKCCLGLEKGLGQELSGPDHEEHGWVTEGRLWQDRLEVDRKRNRGSLLVVYTNNRGKEPPGRLPSPAQWGGQLLTLSLSGGGLC